MSLSWIKNASLLTSRYLPVSFFKNASFSKLTSAWQDYFSLLAIKNKPTLGIILGRNHIWAVHCSRNKASREIDWAESCQLERSLFTGSPTAALKNELNSFFSTIRERLDGKFVQVQVSLPDPVAFVGFYPVDAIPNNPVQARELANWRISKQFHAQDKNLLCDYQQVGLLDGKKLLMAVACHAEWLVFLQEQLLKNTMLAPVTDISITHIFNQLEEKEKSESGAVINLADEYWSVLAWNDEGYPRFVRSRWRKAEQNNPGADLDDIAAEIIQTLLVYSHEGQAQTINKVLISGRETERTILADHLQQQMTQAVTYPDVELSGVVKNTTNDPSFPPMAYSVVILR